ncbi:hypothetical protein XENOCAPTIV_030488 [Xenoophorus captivus]|uniref:Uncharacterized protein n=1 Tax=Xenoophorus captivus TaxID=1517983 RepID=A0ABV0SDE1_9TELE
MDTRTTITRHREVRVSVGQTRRFSGGKFSLCTVSVLWGSPWMEAVSPDGYTYFYNTETGGEGSLIQPDPFGCSVPDINHVCHMRHLLESSWVKPADLLSSEEPETKQDEENGAEPLISQLEPLPGGEDSSGGATQEVQPAESDQKLKIPKIYFRLAFFYYPSANVDLQLPQTDEGTAGTPADLPPEPKPKFKERVITSLGEEGGPTSFRKNKNQNGKSRSLRQRDDDD